MKTKPKTLAGIPAVLFALCCAAPAQQFAVTVERLQQYLKSYPEADTNKDGVLSEEEARAYLSKMRKGKTAEPAAKDQRHRKTRSVLFLQENMSANPPKHGFGRGRLRFIRREEMLDVAQQVALFDVMSIEPTELR